MGGLVVRPIGLREANAYVDQVHRHHKSKRGHRWSLAAYLDGKLVGVLVASRPAARKTNQEFVIEVARLATDGTKNACSILYAAAARAAKAMGFWWIQTFTLEEEPGTSLLAAGWSFDGHSAGGDWNVPSRGDRRVDQPQGPKKRWKKQLNPQGDA